MGTRLDHTAGANGVKEALDYMKANGKVRISARNFNRMSPPRFADHQAGAGQDSLAMCHLNAVVHRVRVAEVVRVYYE